MVFLCCERYLQFRKYVSSAKYWNANKQTNTLNEISEVYLGIKKKITGEENKKEKTYSNVDNNLNF